MYDSKVGGVGSLGRRVVCRWQTNELWGTLSRVSLQKWSVRVTSGRVAPPKGPQGGEKETPGREDEVTRHSDRRCPALFCRVNTGGTVPDYLFHYGPLDTTDSAGLSFPCVDRQVGR